MTDLSQHVEAHPDPMLIAAHVDGRLTGDEAARLDEHIAACADCYDVFSESVRFALSESEDASPSQEPAPRAARAHFRRRSRLGLTAGLSLAAALFLAVGLWFFRWRPEGDAAPLVAMLVEAMGERRFVEPRVTGGFRHGRLTTLRSGDTPRGLDAQSPAVLAAVAGIRRRAETDVSPEVLGAVGVTYLVSGDAVAAVKSLESAVAQKPEDPRLLSDLAAAYLVRAKQVDEAADVPKALEAAERAVALKDAPPEAYFNRALALEGLHLTDAAHKAWDDYLQHDSTSGWADEARQHLEALPGSKQSSVEEERARVRAAFSQGPAAVDSIAEGDPQLLRDYLEDEVLTAWAEAHLVGHPDATIHRERAGMIGDVLLRATGDAMARDVARALTEPDATATSPDPVGAQARGLRDLGEARRLDDHEEASCVAFRRALAGLEAGGSPQAAAARLQVVIACSYPDGSPASADLARLEDLSRSSSYWHLLGRVHRMSGFVHARRGELTVSLERYRSAVASFQRARDVESQAVVQALLAEILHFLGETRGAWQERQRGLVLLGQVRDPRRRHGMLGEAALACLYERMPRSALHFGTALLGSAFALSRPIAINDALVRRASIHHGLGADDMAAADVRESRRWIARIGDRSLAEKQKAEVDAAEGEILVSRQPESASRVLGESLAYFRSTAPARVPALYLLLARAQLALGFDEAAEANLLTGIEELERQRISLRDAGLQVSFFDQALPLFDDMVRLQASKRHDPERALAFVERGRARQLVDSLAGADMLPLDPAALRRELSEGVALVYFLPLGEDVLTWVVSREGLHFIARPLRAAELSRLVASNRAAIEGRAPQVVVRETAARLHDELVRPIIPFITSQRALVIVPGGVLESVAFAALWDRQTGRYLVEDYLLGVAPSGTVFVRASTGAAATRSTAPRALVVGNPHFDRRLWTGLSNLAEAQTEAEEVARLYPRSELLTGGAATKAAFLQGARASQVVHYAGHAVAGDLSSPAQLFLAPDPGREGSGALQLRELGLGRFPRTRVVVLAACRTAAGGASRVEGTLSLGRPFLAAGVPHVVASLWDIDDLVSRRFFVAFHRTLLADGDPVLALRKTQIAMLHDPDVSLAHPASWAAFICMGGLDPHSFTKGEVS